MSEQRQLRLSELTLLREMERGNIGPKEIDFSDSPLANYDRVRRVARTIDHQLRGDDMANSETGPPRICKGKCGKERPASSFYRGKDVCRSCYLLSKRSKTDNPLAQAAKTVSIPAEVEALPQIDLAEMEFERDVWKRAAFHWWRVAMNKGKL